MYFFLQLMYYVDIAMTLLTALIVLYSVLSWFARPTSSFYRFIYKLVDPFLSIFRPLAMRIMGRGFRINLTPFLAIICIQLVRALLGQLVYWVIAL